MGKGWNWFEFDHHAVSTSFLERLWSYFRKMSNPLPEQPFLTKFSIQARLLWGDPGQQRWPGPSSQFILYNLITPSTHSSQSGYPLPRLRTDFDTCSLPIGCLHWLSLPELLQHSSTTTPAMTTPSPSSLYNTIIGLPVPCLSSEPSLPDPASAATTASSLSPHHQQSACSTKLHIGWRHCDQLVLQVTYLTVMCAFHVVGGPAKGLLSLEHPKGWLDEINIWLMIDWCPGKFGLKKGLEGCPPPPRVT